METVRIQLKKGKYKLNDGSVYEGEFSNDNINGKVGI